MNDYSDKSISNGIRNYSEYIDALRQLNKDNKGKTTDEQIEKFISKYELDRKFKITKWDVRSDLHGLHKEIDSYEEYIGYLQTMYIMARGEINDELINDFIAEFNLDSRFEIALEDVYKDVEMVSRKVNNYEQYINTLNNLFSSCKENVESSDIENFIIAYKLDERFGITFNDVMQDLIIVKTNNDINKKQVISKGGMFTVWRDTFRFMYLDAKIEGRKAGYNIASREFEPVLMLLRNIYSTVKQVVQNDKAEYGEKAITLNEQLEILNLKTNVVSDNCTKNVEKIAKSYDVPIDDLKKELHSIESKDRVYDILTGYIALACLTNPIIGIKKANYNKYKQIGYKEAKKIYEDKLTALKNDFAFLASKSEKDIKELIGFIINNQELLWEKNIECVQMELLNNDINEYSNDVFEVVKELENDVDAFDKGEREVKRVINVVSNSDKILDELDKEFCEKTGLTPIDMCCLFLAIGLQIARQYLLSNEKCRLSHSQGDQLMDSALSLAPPNWKEVLTQSVPYDAIKTGAHVSDTGLAGTTHRYRTLGHDPILGWIFGTANIMTNSLTKTNFETYQVKNMQMVRHYPMGVVGMLENAISYSMNDPKLLVVSVVRQAIHFGSDYFTKQGLPVPLIATVNNDLAKKMLSEWHVDMLSVTRGMMLSTFINQLIATIHGLFYDGVSEKNYKIYEVRTRKILSYSNLIATSSNIAVVAITKDMEKLDIGGMATTVYRLITDAKFIRQVKEEFIFGSFREMIMGDDIVLS